MKNMLSAAKSAKPLVAALTTQQKNDALRAMAKALRENADIILEANALDLSAAEGKIPTVMLDRLMLNFDRVEGMAQGVEGVISLPDPVGKVIWETERPNGLKIKRVSSPLGVIGIGNH